ncbi:class I SAM-dependent methyltransferase [Streptomyces sp. LP11]|uniref:Class I SAM-dependent methyltransferase n=1 Tax=Streptomyces pyxinicus TaxID=2970331 RepID=A0ABT2AUY2_9ACTN|nr:class I SAM-dependent methyltransferase [Streptomyces sp. LP11]MCS0599956.1 class I SAM-dependent methyltransferase [Streptomyces sp. LP11]
MAPAHHHTHRHATGHDHGTAVDWGAQASHLESEADLMTPVYERAMAWLAREVTDPGLIVDAGSGPGVVSCLFAEAFPAARILAVDGSEPLLERARARAARQGVTDRFDTLTGELPTVLSELDYPADLLWAGRSLHHLGDQRAALTAFADRLAPGGTLVLLEGGLPTRFLPRDIGIGRPGLQARLDALEEERFARMRAGLPGSAAETEDWTALLTAAGLIRPRTRSFLLDLPAPATARTRAYVVATLAHLRDGFSDTLTPEDRTTLDHLLAPSAPTSVHHRPDVFVLGAYTVHTAVRPV